MTAAERAVLAVSQARELCLSLERAFLGPRAVARLRRGDVHSLTPRELRVAMGLAWAVGEHALVRDVAGSLGRQRVEGDPVLAALAEAAETAAERASTHARATPGGPDGA